MSKKEIAMLSPERIWLINSMLRDVGVAINRQQGLMSFLMECLPFVGRYFIRRRVKKKKLRDILLLDKLIDAFRLGYVPGITENGPKEWRNTTIIYYFERYHPDNGEYFKELDRLIQERCKSSANVPIANTTANGYQVYLSVDAIMDLEGLSPQMKHSRRLLSYGNPDDWYWYAWARGIQACIQET